MAAADFQIDDGGPGLTLRLTGDWTATELGRISRRLDDELHERRVDSVDLSDLGRFDTAGALAIVQAANCVLPQSAWTQRPGSYAVIASARDIGTSRHCPMGRDTGGPHPRGASGNKQASSTCNSLSRAKFMTKSQAMGSRSRKASLTTTHLTLSTLVGTQ